MGAEYKIKISTRTEENSVIKSWDITFVMEIV
jgi:hypothetical protein